MSQQIWNTSHRNSQSSLLTDSIQSSYVNVGGCRMWKNVLNNKNAELHFIICLWLSSLFNILSPYHLPQPRFNQRIMPSIFEIKICQDFPWHYERLQINSQSLRSVILITNKIELLLAKKWGKRCDLPVMETLRENVPLCRKNIILSQPHMPERVAKFGKRAMSEV
mgnify:CR=1 FL=1